MQGFLAENFSFKVSCPERLEQCPVKCHAEIIVSFAIPIMERELVAVNIYIYIYTYTHTHTYIYMYIRMCIYIYR